MITLAALISAGIAPTQARAFLTPMLETCDRFDIDTPQRQAAFVAQCSHESSGFTRLEEDLRWRNPERLDAFFSAVRGVDDAKALILAGPKAIANRVYGNRNGNGPESSCDGWTYRGRGCIQLTGRANYTAAALALSEPYIEHPELVATPRDACLTAGWYWDRNRINGLADMSDIDGCTRAVNGPAMAGRDERRLLYSRALAAFR